MDNRASERPAISAVMITRNAARLLPDVLAGLAWCDEIVVVDSGSTDDTRRIVGEHGARVLERAFDGYGAQKRFAVEQARNDWVLVVDADEIVGDELRAEIARTVGAAAHADPPIRGFEVPISLKFLGRLMRHGGEFKKPHLRLFDKRYGNYNTARVHEDVTIDGRIGHLDHDIVHDSYGSLHEYFEKFNHYTTAGARDLFDRGRHASLWQVALRMPLTFIKEYFGKRNILNGYPGFVWSLFSSMYPVVKYAKLRELQSASTRAE